MTVEDVLALAVPDPESCRCKADDLIAEYPHLTREQIARRAVKSARKWAACTGAATGMVANPVIMLPAAAAEFAGILRIEGKMAGVVAALLDPDSLNYDETFKAEVLGILFPGVVSQALRELGVRGGQVLSRSLIRGYLNRGLVKIILRLLAKYLGIRLTERAILSKTIPVVGAGIGATWNWIEIEAVGARAVSYYRTPSKER